MTTRSSSPLASPRRLSSLRLLAAPAALLALAACSATTTTGEERDDDDEAASPAACLPASSCGAGRTRLAGAGFDGHSAVIDMAADGDALVMVWVQGPTDQDRPMDGSVLTRGAIGEAPRWSLSLGDSAAVVDVDDDGTIAVAGTFEGTTEVLGTALSSRALADEAGLPPTTPGMYVARLDRDGHLLGLRAAARDLTLLDVAIRGDAVAIAGIAFGVTAPSPEDIRSDAYVALVGGDLAFAAEHVSRGVGPDAATSVRFRGDGALLVGGTFEESVSFDKVELRDPTAGPSAFVGVIDPGREVRGIVPVDDEALRTRGYRATGVQIAWSEAGGTTANLAYDGGDPELETGLDRRPRSLVQLDDDLHRGEARRIPGLSDASVTVAHDGAGGFLLGGSVDGPVTVGDAVLEARGSLDGFAMHLDAELRPTWATRFGDDQMQWSLAMDTSAAGDVVLAGAFLGSITLGDATIDAGDDANQAFVVELAVPR